MILTKPTQRIQTVVDRLGGINLFCDLLNFLISHPSSGFCTGLRLTNVLNINSSHSPTKFSQPANLPIYITWSVQSTCIDWLCDLRRPAYTEPGDRCFAVADPRVWNSLPTEIRQSSDSLEQLNGD